MTEPTTPIFFCRTAFSATPEQVFQALDADGDWASMLGGTSRDGEPGVRRRLDHAASQGIIEASVAARGEGARLTVTLFADDLARPALDALARQTCELFEALEARLGAAPNNLLPPAWPAVYEAPGTPPRVLRRADYAWKVARYDDLPDDTMGEYASLTRPLGVTQFGADVHRLMPGERNCRNHSELHEQEAFLVLSGTCHLEVEGQVVELGTGDIGVTFPGEEHHFFNGSAAPCEVLTFGGPDLFASGATYPHGTDAGWRERLRGHFA
ncbi:MAG: cupin protein [Cyanobacteria bacterium RYN_339]|nr:cupin protein [Cyanobacteria bacterium RYN_339]